MKRFLADPQWASGAEALRTTAGIPFGNKKQLMRING